MSRPLVFWDNTTQKRAPKEKEQAENNWLALKIGSTPVREPQRRFCVVLSRVSARRTENTAMAFAFYVQSFNVVWVLLVFWHTLVVVGALTQWGRTIWTVIGAGDDSESQNKYMYTYSPVVMLTSTQHTCLIQILNSGLNTIFSFTCIVFLPIRFLRWKLVWHSQRWIFVG